MRRKMLKEERTLRQSTLVCAKPCEHCKGISKEITTFERAVREYCAKLVEEEKKQDCSCNTCEVLSDIAAAIRGGNGR